jgi:hypothetical protein
MDAVKILKRAWQILWNYPVLWVFGLIIAMTTAGASSGGGGNGNVKFNGTRFNLSEEYVFPEDFREVFKDVGAEFDRAFTHEFSTTGISDAEVTSILWIAGVFVLIMIAVGLVMTVLSYVSQNAVIKMVNDYEDTGEKMSIRQGFKQGWSKSAWRLFLINLINSLPILFLFSTLLIIGYRIAVIAMKASATFASAKIIALVGLAFLIVFLLIIVVTLIKLVQHFMWRTSVLENTGVRESFRQGFAMVKENWKSVGIMWLSMIGVNIVWMIASFVAFFIMIPVVIVTSIAGVLVAIIPTLFLVAIFSTFLNGALPWIVGAVFMLPLFGIIAFSPWALFSAWQRVYSSSVWTLTYREIKSLPILATDENIEALPEPEAPEVPESPAE